MEFLDREAETTRLDALLPGGGLGVVYGRRRVGKTRLLVEWCRRQRGAYFVADLSGPEVQRRYLADVLGVVLPGFGEVRYPDWRALLSRLAREARAVGWRGPLVLDEVPYLVAASPELPSVLQRWLDHEAADLAVVIAGSSQSMMDGIVLDGSAPLFGRARALLPVLPLPPSWVLRGLPACDPVEALAAFGGVPRYWELARECEGDVCARVDQLVLDPLGPLHAEPDRLIHEELPPAGEARPLLDAIGDGAHRLSEVAARCGRSATALSRPLRRLQGMGLVGRALPFGADEHNTKRSVYEIVDPLVRLWFRVVAPHRSFLASALPADRLALLARYWPQLVGLAWEALCRDALPTLSPESRLGSLGPWLPARRWWQGNAPEWDVVARSVDGRRLLVGEAKLGTSPGDVGTRALPAVPEARELEVVRVGFCRGARRAGQRADGVWVIDAGELLGA